MVACKEEHIGKYDALFG
jgi:hypothetical protein